MDSAYALALPADQVEFVASTPAGRLNFDNPASRHIVHALASGPRPLADITDPSIETQDLVANALTLCASNAVWPVESRSSPVDKVNSDVQLVSFRDGAAGGLYDWVRSLTKSN